jgi:hypothetical protein
MEEEWKPVDLFPNYQVSNLGNVKNVKTGLPVKPYLTGRGYYYVRFYKRKGGANGTDFLISRLVASMWLENPDDRKEINHRDGDKANNAVSNLEWSNRKENLDHARKTRLVKNNFPIHAVNLSTEESWDFYSIGHAAKFFNFYKTCICRALNRSNNIYQGIQFFYLEYNAVEYEDSALLLESQESLASSYNKVRRKCTPNFDEKKSKN